MDDLSNDVVLAVAGFLSTLATATYACWSSYFSESATLREISAAPSAHVSDLRSLLGDSDGKLVVVRGQVQAAMAGSLGLGPKLPLGALIADRSRQWSVVVQETDTNLYDWSFLNNSCVRSRSVRFALVEGGQYRSSACVDIRLDNSTHPLPLTWVYHDKHTVQSPMYSSTGARFVGGYPVGKLTEECILPVGKEITAVGVCRNHNGVLEINSCMKLPYFLSDKTKDEIEAEFTSKSNDCFWCGVVLGTLLVGFVGYAGYVLMRNWRKKKQLRNRRQKNQNSSQNRGQNWSHKRQSTSQNQESSREEQHGVGANGEDLEVTPES